MNFTFRQHHILETSDGHCWFSGGCLRTTVWSRHVNKTDTSKETNKKGQSTECGRCLQCIVRMGFSGVCCRGGWGRAGLGIGAREVAHLLFLNKHNQADIFAIDAIHWETETYHYPTLSLEGMRSRRDGQALAHLEQLRGCWHWQQGSWNVLSPQAIFRWQD